MLLHFVAVVILLSKYVHAASGAAAAADAANGELTTEGVTTLDGVAIDSIAEGRSAESVISTSIPKDNWTATADSYQPGHPPSNVLDDSLNTFWHTTYTPGLPPSARTGVSSFLY